MPKKIIYLFILFFCIFNIQKSLAFCESPFLFSYAKVNTANFSAENIENYNYQASTTCNIENFGFYKGDIILKFELLDVNLLTELLSINNPHIDEIQVYNKTNNNTYKLTYQTGDLMNFGQRLNKDFLIPLEGKSTFFIRITNYGAPLFLSFSFLNKEHLTTKYSTVNFYHGLFYGILSLTILFNLYLWIKKRSCIHYSLFLTFIFLLVFTLEGYSYQLLWPNSPYLQQIMVPVCVLLVGFFMIRFFQFYFKTQKHIPKINKLLNKLSTILPLVLLFFLFPQKEMDLAKYILINGICIIFLILFILSFKKLFYTLNNELWLTSVSLFIFFACVIIQILSNFNLIPYSSFVRHSIEFGTFVQIVLLTFAITIRFKKFKQSKIEQLVRANRFKQQENLKLVQKVKDRKKEIFEQSKILEHQNSSIIQSITYSYNVQSALLPLDEELDNYFKKHFLIYQPKDIVSGDFYWVKNINIYENGIKNNYTLAAVGDCTGHGIPGALISVLAINTLNQAVRLAENKTTEDLLNFLNEEINSIFNSNISDENIRDGLDIAICAINNTTNKLFYSTAKSQILHLRNGKLNRLKTSNNPIGIQEIAPEFNRGVLHLEKNDIIYLLSDGFADQFGGPYGKKFKSNTLKNKLIHIHKLEMDKQKSELQETLKNWKGNQEQTDDVTILGIGF